MRSLKTIQGSTIKTFSSPKEMTIGRYSEFQKYLMLESGIESLVSSLTKALAYSQEQKPEDCELEIQNSLNTINSVNDGVKVNSYPFAIFVTEINGEYFSDYTKEGLDLILEKLDKIGFSMAELVEEFEDLKKKLNSEIESLFPDFKEKLSNLAYFSRLKRYLLMICGMYGDGSLPNAEDEKLLRTEKNWFLTKDKAKNNKEQSLEIERNFLSLLALLEFDENVSVLTFYSKLDYINKKNQRELEASKK